MRLTNKQQEILDRITNAPIDDGTMLWWQIKRSHENNGTITGKFNSATIRALQNGGFIEIIKDEANREMFDVIKLK